MQQLQRLEFTLNNQGQTFVRMPPLGWGGGGLLEPRLGGAPCSAPPTSVAQGSALRNQQHIAMHATRHRAHPVQMPCSLQPSLDHDRDPDASSGGAPPTSAAKGIGRGRRPRSPRPTSATWDRWAAALGQHMRCRRPAALPRNACRGCGAFRGPPKQLDARMVVNGACRLSQATGTGKQLGRECLASANIACPQSETLIKLPGGLNRTLRGLHGHHTRAAHQAHGPAQGLDLAGHAALRQQGTAFPGLAACRKVGRHWHRTDIAHQAHGPVQDLGQPCGRGVALVPSDSRPAPADHVHHLDRRVCCGLQRHLQKCEAG